MPLQAVITAIDDWKACNHRSIRVCLGYPPVQPPSQGLSGTRLSWRNERNIKAGTAVSCRERVTWPLIRAGVRPTGARGWALTRCWKVKETGRSQNRPEDEVSPTHQNKVCCIRRTDLNFCIYFDLPSKTTASCGIWQMSCTQTLQKLKKGGRRNAQQKELCKR